MVADQGGPSFLNAQDKAWWESNIQNHAMGAVAMGTGGGTSLSARGSKGTTSTELPANVSKGTGENSVGVTSLKIPDAASMTNLEARQWYLAQETNIPKLIDTTASVEQQVYQAWGLRNDFRTAARNAMSDQGAAEKLNVTNPNLT
jgi:hypothetical protein